MELMPKFAILNLVSFSLQHSGHFSRTLDFAWAMPTQNQGF